MTEHSSSETAHPLQEVLDFLNKIEGDGYGGMASFEIARSIVKNAIGAPAQCALDQFRKRLREHWITGIVCDHEAKTDRATCSCSRWRCDPLPNVGAAVNAWIDHVLSVCDRCNGDGETTHPEGGPQYECSDCGGTGVSTVTSTDSPRTQAEDIVAQAINESLSALTSTDGGAK